MTLLSRERAKVHKTVSLQCSNMCSSHNANENRQKQHPFGANLFFGTIYEHVPFQGRGQR